MIQSYWISLQHVMKNMRYEFAEVERNLQETFLPRFFFVKSEFLPSIVGNLGTMPVNKSVMGLENMVTSANEKFLSFQCARS